MSITINPAQYNQMLHNWYILVELPGLVYAVLQGSALNVALAIEDNVLKFWVNNSISFLRHCRA